MIKIIFSCSLLLIAFSCLSQNAWIQKSPLPAAARTGAVAFSINDLGYIGTGQDSSGNLLKDFWQYDPTVDSWKQVADFSGSARRNAVSFVANSFGYVGTGYNGNNLTDFYKYDPSVNVWSQANSINKDTSAAGRREAMAFSIDPKGYVVSGYDGTSNYSSDTWQYDESRSINWKNVKSFPSTGRRWGVAFTIEKYGFCGMGYDHTQIYRNDLWKYDTAANVWSQMASYTGSARGNAVAFSVVDRAFVGTGFDGIYKKDFFVYNFLSNSWSALADFSGGPTSAAVAFSAGGKGYICCGRDSVNYKNELWEYTPDSIVGINNLDKEDLSLTLFPNPVSKELHLLLPVLKEDAKLILRDVLGRQVKVLSLGKREHQKIISIKELPVGTYTLQLQTNSQTITKSFIKE